jgi:mannose PTS system EIID component
MTEHPRGVRIRMLLRSFAVQGSWNYETLIGTGFVFALLPALRRVYGERGEELDAAVARHTDLFNSHPYFATVAVGAVAKLEAEGTPPAVIQRFKTALRGSLGSIGDRLVWTSWRPMCSLVAIVLLLLGLSWWVAVLCFLVLYNALHLAIRTFGLDIGLRGGLEVGRVLREAPIQPVIEIASRVGSVLVGVGVILASAPALSDLTIAPLALIAAGAGLVLGMRARRAIIALLVATTVLSLLLGIAGYGA